MGFTREQPPEPGTWRHTLHEVIFEAETPRGKAFDIGLLVLIVASIVAVSLESVAPIRVRYGDELRWLEWAFTLAFTVEYVLRLIAVARPTSYALSFFGLVDLLSILPTYLSIFFAGSHSLIVIRALRLLRIFRVLKLGHFVGEARLLRVALVASTRKIIVFLGTVCTLVVIIGAAMYLIEDGRPGFHSIPHAIYWSIVTLTTVGFGDVVPQTGVGKFFASLVMISGYGIIAVPTGIVSVELAQATQAKVTAIACKVCSAEGHANDARYCKFCGAALSPPPGA